MLPLLLSPLPLSPLFFITPALPLLMGKRTIPCWANLLTANELTGVHEVLDCCPTVHWSACSARCSYRSQTGQENRRTEWERAARVVAVALAVFGLTVPVAVLEKLAAWW